MAVERSTGTERQDDAAKSKTAVLLIHQDGEVAAACAAALEKHGFEIQTATDGNDGVQKIYRSIPDIILAGSSVPELNGYQICRLTKSDPVMKKIPILLIADSDEKMDRFWGVKAGADDFLKRDEIPAKLLRKIQMVLDIYDRMDIREKRQMQAGNEKNPFNIRTRLNQILDTALVESTLMVEFRSLSDLIHSPSLLNYMLFSLLENIVEYDAAALFYNDENKGPRQVTFHIPEGLAQPTPRIEKMMESFFKQFEDNGLTPQQLELVESEVIGTLDEEAEATEYDTVYTKEFRVDGQLIGAFTLYSEKKVDYGSIFPVYLVEDEIRLLMKLRHLYSQAEILAITNSLTGLYNQRHFMIGLLREFKSSRRYELDLSLVLVGIDNFRQLNEEWGHNCGDEALKHVAHLAEASFRSVDIAARFGGKYLAVVFPKTPGDQSLIALERFRKSVAETPLVWQDSRINVTVSCGLASLRPEMEGVSELIKQAEEGLLQARSLGSNRIEISPA